MVCFSPTRVFIVINAVSSGFVSGNFFRLLLPISESVMVILILFTNVTANNYSSSDNYRANNNCADNKSG